MFKLSLTLLETNYRLHCVHWQATMTSHQPWPISGTVRMQPLPTIFPLYLLFTDGMEQFFFEKKILKTFPGSC